MFSGVSTRERLDPCVRTDGKLDPTISPRPIPTTYISPTTSVFSDLGEHLAHAGVDAVRGLRHHDVGPARADLPDLGRLGGPPQQRDLVGFKWVSGMVVNGG